MTTRILVGDVRERLAEIPDASIHCCVTSPPYYSLRDYNCAGQIGLEPTLAEYLDALVGVFREVRRVLRDDGTLWLNIGDSYCSHDPGGYRPGEFLNPGGRQSEASRGARNKAGTYKQPGLKAKDLMLVPERLAISLQADGWWVRSRIIWAKKACMPESVTDRPTNAHEHIWLLTKSARYFYDAEAVREDSIEERPLSTWESRKASGEPIRRGDPGQSGHITRTATLAGVSGRNQRNVWHLGPEPFAQAHFATFVTEIPRRAIKAGTSEHGCCEACGAPWVRTVEKGGLVSSGPHKIMERRDRSTNRRPGAEPLEEREKDSWGNLPRRVKTTTGWAPSCQCDAGVIPCTVLDPFLGSGTTLMVADQLGRNGIGIELNADYALMSERRIRGDAPMFAAVSVEPETHAHATLDSEVA